MIDLNFAIEQVVNYANERWGELSKAEFIFNEEEEILDLEDIWYIQFIEKNPAKREPWIGAGKGCIVDKLTGEMCQPGSRYTLEDQIWAFRLGIKGGHVDFSIIRINDMSKSIELISHLRVQYLVQNESGKYEVNDIEYYSEKQIKKKLENLPCIFKSQSLSLGISNLKEIIKNNVFHFKITKSQEKYGPYYGELITKKQLMKIS